MRFPYENLIFFNFSTMKSSIINIRYVPESISSKNVQRIKFLHKTVLQSFKEWTIAIFLILTIFQMTVVFQICIICGTSTEVVFYVRELQARGV